jgi:hypothetical protein
MPLSVNVYVYNRLGNTDLILINEGLDHGEWNTDPYPMPGGIPANDLGQWCTQADGFLTGTQGWVRYYPVRHGQTPSFPTSPPDEETIYIEWDAPYAGTNSYQCTAPAPYVITANTAQGNAGAGSGGFYAGAASLVIDLTGASGANTCAEGYVWRDAFENDFVCVTPAARQQAADQNGASARHKESEGSDCKQGFVWREASGPGKGDDVCVSPADRDLAAQQNANAKQYTL